MRFCLATCKITISGSYVYSYKGVFYYCYWESDSALYTEFYLFILFYLNLYNAWQIIIVFLQVFSTQSKMKITLKNALELFIKIKEDSVPPRSSSKSLKYKLMLEGSIVNVKAL